VLDRDGGAGECQEDCLRICGSVIRDTAPGVEEVIGCQSNAGRVKGASFIAHYAVERGLPRLAGIWPRLLPTGRPNLKGCKSGLRDGCAQALRRAERLDGIGP
jgi:hypothetical protein